MFEGKLRGRSKAILAPVVSGIGALGISANMLTLFGLVVNVIAGIALATGCSVIAGVLILFGGSFDMIDGAVARASAKKNSSGALLDSVIDRYSESVVFLGAMIYFFQRGNLLGIVLVFTSAIGSILVSYVRARAEGLEIQCKVGLMQRPERIILLAVGALAQGLVSRYSLWGSNGVILMGVFAVLAITSHITAVHRLAFGFSELKNR